MMNDNLMKESAVKPRITKLPQGVQIVTISQPDKQSVSIGFWVRVGSRYESLSNAGVSHFLEHMLFKGTRVRSARKIKEDIEGSGGLLNAFTSEESTCYFTKIMSGKLGLALEVLTDMFLHATLEEKDFKKEREVIIEEIKMYEDVPAQQVQDLIGELMWPGHPLGRPISGTEKSLLKMTARDMVRFKRRHYHPGNLVISAAGAVTHEEVVDSAKKLFRRKKEGGTFNPKPARGISADQSSLFVRKTAEQANFVIGVPAFSRYHPDRYKLALLNLILGGNMSSRLFEALREKRGLAYEIRSSGAFYRDTGALFISAGAEPSKTRQTVKVIFSELKKLQERPVGKLELRRAKDYFISQFLMSLEDSLDHMFWVGESFVYKAHIPSEAQICRRIEAVTSDEIKQTADKLFASGAFRLACIGPLTEKDQRGIEKDLAAS